MDNALTITPNIVVHDQKAEQLGSRAKASGDQLTDAKRKELKKISQDFESLFTGMMLKSMRSTVAEDKLTGGGKAEETFRYMLDQEYATIASKRGGAGSIAAMVEKDLLRHYGVPSSKIADKAGKE